tara:strand:- start:207 stop:416 length:210 start_codon:yes stop_codon:yes gene_type:complete
MENFEMERFWLNFFKISNPEKYSSRKKHLFLKIFTLKKYSLLKKFATEKYSPLKNIHPRKYSPLRIVHT